MCKKKKKEIACSLELGDTCRLKKEQQQQQLYIYENQMKRKLRYGSNKNYYSL
jgi:hypothetical protein